MIERLGFDNEKYLEMQSEHIRSRIDQFGGKLYLEFGGKLFDDNHASRVLPGFHPDSKIRMLMQLKDQVEIVVAVSAMDLEKSKVRGDLGITYGTDTLRLIDAFRGFGFPVGSVVLTRFSGQPAAEIFQSQLEALGLKVYRHYSIEGYPYDIPLIVSEEGYGKNEFVEMCIRDSCTVAELDLSRLKAPKVRLLPLGDGRGLLVVGRGRDSVEFVQHSLEDHHKAHAAGVHHPGLFQHRVLVHRVRQGLPGPLKGRSQHILKGGVFLRRPAGPVPRQTGDSEHRPLRRLHHRLIGRDHPRVQRVGQVNACLLYTSR